MIERRIPGSIGRVGIIALDIDGTITGATHRMPREVERYLHGLAKSGWAIFFVTGRSFTYGHEVLRDCTFPYAFGFCNGAVICHMPEKEILYRCDLPRESIDRLQKLAAPFDLDFFIHTDREVYYRPQGYDAATLAYLENRRRSTGEQWIAIESYEMVPLENFLYAKFFGMREPLERLESVLQQTGRFHVSVIEDPLRKEACVMLVTDSGANKGTALDTFRELAEIDGPAIAAGDDYNDEMLLAAADIAIAMGTAPRELIVLADIVAPPSTEMGIIQGLKEALEEIGELS